MDLTSHSPDSYPKQSYRVRPDVVACALAAALTACGPVEPSPTPTAAGDPLPGLTASERVRFEEGARLFSTLFTAAEGLGPRFNENACNACHTDPADGGTGEQLVVKASRWVEGEGCEPLTDLGGENLRRLATPALVAAGGNAVPIPTEATHQGRFTTPFLFGAGLVDQIPAEAIAALADPDDENGDGISGRLGTDGSGRMGRFGRKASVADLATFVDEAFRLEMGMTTPLHPAEGEAGAVPSVPEGVDEADDPELDEDAVARVLDFVSLLAPLPQAPVPADREEDVARGQGLFQALGCSVCHTPSFQTGEAASPALSNRSISLYSDLLLHDMGEGLAGPCTPGASPTEYRTEPLMGLGRRSQFLHDGRARRVIDAVLLHGGEAQAARDAFRELDRLRQEELLTFLATL